MVSTMLCTLFPVTTLSAALQRPQDPGQLIRHTLSQEQADFMGISSASRVTTIDLTQSNDSKFFENTTHTLTILNSSSLPSIPSHSYDITALNKSGTPICDGEEYGYDLNRANCAEALSQYFPNGDRMISWGQRLPELDVYDVVLPYRIGSCMSFPYLRHISGYMRIIETHDLPDRWMYSFDTGHSKLSMCGRRCAFCWERVGCAASYNQVKSAAQQVLNVCVNDRSSGQGGLIGWVGRLP